MEVEEIWKPVVGYEGLYEVSNQGKVRSLDCDLSCTYKGKPFTKKRKGVNRNPVRQKNGYLKVTLSKQAKSKSHWVHILVAAAFLGERPSGYQVCHRDGNPTNNLASNLRYDTQSANQAERVFHGTSNRGEQHGSSVLTIEKVEEIFRLRAEGVKQKDIAARLGCSRQAVYSVASGRTWRWFSDML